MVEITDIITTIGTEGDLMAARSAARPLFFPVDQFIKGADFAISLFLLIKKG